MPLSDRGYAVVLPEVKGDDMSSALDFMYQQKQRQQALEIQRQKQQQDQEDQMAEFLSQQIKENRVLTNTPYDDVINGKLSEIQRNYSQMIAKNPGMSKADLMMGMSKDLADVSLWRQKASQMKQAIDQQIDGAEGINKPKTKALLYNRVFMKDGQFRRGSDLSPELVQGEFENLLFDRSEDIIPGTKEAEDYVKSFQNETITAKRKTVGANRSQNIQKGKITIPKGLYKVSGDIGEDGIIDENQVEYVPRTKEDIMGDARLYRPAINITKQYLINKGHKPSELTKDFVEQNMPEAVNTWLKDRAPVSKDFSVEKVAAPIIHNNTTIVNGTVDRKPDIFSAAKEGQKWATDILPVKKVYGKDYYDVTAPLTQRPKSKSEKGDFSGNKQDYTFIGVDKTTGDITATTEDGQGEQYTYGTPEYNSFVASVQNQPAFEKLSGAFDSKKNKPPRIKPSPIGVKRTTQAPMFNPLSQ